MVYRVGNEVFRWWTTCSSREPQQQRCSPPAHLTDWHRRCGDASLARDASSRRKTNRTRQEKRGGGFQNKRARRLKASRRLYRFTLSTVVWEMPADISSGAGGGGLRRRSSSYWLLLNTNLKQENKNMDEILTNKTFDRSNGLIGGVRSGFGPQTPSTSHTG